MGDVVTALGRAVQEEGHRVEVILPKFDCINYKEVGTGQKPGLFVRPTPETFCVRQFWLVAEWQQTAVFNSIPWQEEVA